MAGVYRPNWFLIFKGDHPAIPKLNELVLVSRGSLSIALLALDKQNIIAYDPTAGAAQTELMDVLEVDCPNAPRDY